MRRDLIVPKGKSPLDVLAEQGEGIRNTWIFLHESVVLKLKASEGVVPSKAYNGGTLLRSYLRKNGRSIKGHLTEKGVWQEK